MVIVELKEMETSSGIYEEEDNIQIDFGEGTEASTEIFPNFIETIEAQEDTSENDEFLDQNETISELESANMETVLDSIEDSGTEAVVVSINRGKEYQMQSELLNLSGEELEDARNIMELKDGDLIVIRQVSKLSADAPILFSEYPIAYAIDVKDGSESDIMVYRFNGVNHTYILDNDEEVTDDQKADFKNFIETLYKTGDLSILSNDGRSFTVTKEKKYSDVYIEAGDVPHNAEWKIKTTFQVAQNLTTPESDAEMYAIRGIHKVYPYGWTMYATTRYSNEIKRGGIEDEMISATLADKDIELNESTAYSISISYPISFSFAFSWWKEKGTRMVARWDDYRHEIIFSNPNGIVGKGEQGNFTYETYTELKVPKGDDFGFYYKEVFWNSIKGSQSDMREYGDEWLLITPDLNSSEEIGGNENTKEVYIWEGRDYSLVFNGEYYLNKYSDLKTAFGNDKKAAFMHFIQNGMAEGRQGSLNFNVHSYKNRYNDLVSVFGDNLVLYYQHYIDYGYKEGRKGI